MAGRALTHLPDETIEIEVEQRRGHEHTLEHLFERLDRQPLGNVGERAVGEHQPHVKPGQRTAAAEEEAQQATQPLRRLDPLAIEQPDDREVLHVVEDLEQRHADQDVLDHHAAVPPEAKAGGHQQELDRARRVALEPLPQRVGEKRDRDQRGTPGPKRAQP
ncbi:MAG: hypothetical protein HC897_13775 [Thermoanaerobaculia bacterium]|nr:hypothetical protein [Thermoanaerobaculia bacterium]